MRGRESSADALSTTTTRAGRGSFASRESRQASVSSELFQLMTTAPNCGGVFCSRADVTATASWASSGYRAVNARNGLVGAVEGVSHYPRSSARTSAAPVAGGAAEFLPRLGIARAPVLENNGRAGDENSGETSKKERHYSQCTVAGPLRLLWRHRRVDDGDQRGVVEFIKSRDLELSLKREVKLVRYVHTSLDLLLLELEGGRRWTAAIRCVKKSLPLFRACQLRVGTVEPCFDEDPLGLCA